MKRRYLLLTCLLAAAVLTGCAGEDPQNAVRSGVVRMPRTDVEGFLKALDASDIEGQYEAAQCFDVTPARVAEETDYQIFKFADTCASFLLVDGEVYELCAWLGGLGFVDAAPCDLDGDGETDLVVTSSWGSGLHRAQVSFLSGKTKETSVLYDTMGTSNPGVDLMTGGIETPAGGGEALPVYIAEITVGQDLTDLECMAGEAVGHVKAVEGIPVFLPVEPEAFSYAQESVNWAANGEGVRTDGFQNVTYKEVEDEETAMILAAAEVTVPYDRMKAYFDAEEQVWRVDFGKAFQAGGGQSVYLGADGVTRACVWGK